MYHKHCFKGCSFLSADHTVKVIWYKHDIINCIYLEGSLFNWIMNLEYINKFPLQRHCLFSFWLGLLLYLRNHKYSRNLLMKFHFLSLAHIYCIIFSIQYNFLHLRNYPVMVQIVNSTIISEMNYNYPSM